MLYKLKGYPESWIEKRMRGIAIREELTDEWKKRGMKEQGEYEILTAEISKATFGLTPSEYKKFKGLKRQNLRDHMNDLELIFNMLGERVTTEISQQEKPDTFVKNKKVAERGGDIAGNARKQTEKELGRPIVSKENYLPKLGSKKKIKIKFWFLNDVIWVKTDALPNLNGRRFTKQSRKLDLVGQKQGLQKYTFNYEFMKKLNGGKQMKDTDWVFSLCKGKERLKDENGIKAHPTQKAAQIDTAGSFSR